MPVSIAATKLGKNKVVTRATTLSTAGAASADVLTVYHGLGVTPDDISSNLRTIRAVVSTGLPGLVVDSYGPTTVVFRMPAIDAGAVIADWDTVIERTHSFVK